MPGSSYFKSYSTALPRICGSNKAVSVSLSVVVLTPGSAADAFQVCCANVFQFASHLEYLHFRSTDWLHVSIHETSFS